MSASRPSTAATCTRPPRTRSGFRARAVAVEATPAWQGIVDAAKEHGASLLVFGSHRRTGLTGHLFGSVTAATRGHSDVPVLVVHRPE